MKKLLVLTGPQGSGNHLWSKIFSANPEVNGWKQLTEEYWVGHGDEPFADVWEDPSIFNDYDWKDGYHFTSISCPYVIRGGPEMDTDGGGRIPKYDQFIASAKLAGFEVVVGVLGRDHNILTHQQARIRKAVTTHRFLDAYDKFLVKYNPVFLSTEMLHLYQDRYLTQLEQQLQFPIKIQHDNLLAILKDNANAKYIAPIEKYWLDDYMKKNAVNHGRLDNPYKYTKGGQKP